MTNLSGFTQTYAINDLMPYQATPGGFIDMNLFKDSSTTGTSGRPSTMWPSTSRPSRRWPIPRPPPARTCQATTQYFANPASEVPGSWSSATRTSQLITQRRTTPD